MPTQGAFSSEVTKNTTRAKSLDIPPLDPLATNTSTLCSLRIFNRFQKFELEKFLGQRESKYTVHTKFA